MAREDGASAPRQLTQRTSSSIECSFDSWQEVPTPQAADADHWTGAFLVRATAADCRKSPSETESRASRQRSLRRSSRAVSYLWHLSNLRPAGIEARSVCGSGSPVRRAQLQRVNDVLALTPPLMACRRRPPPLETAPSSTCDAHCRAYRPAADTDAAVRRPPTTSIIAPFGTDHLRHASVWEQLF